jgi:Ca2+-binding EF-hand superfamily protein
MRRYTWLLLACLFVLATPSLGASDFMKTLDTNNDGTVDLNEVRAAARRLSDRLRIDEPRLSEVTQQRLKRRLLALVTALFKAADFDGDGTLNEVELRSASGQNLAKLLMH